MMVTYLGWVRGVFSTFRPRFLIAFGKVRCATLPKTTTPRAEVFSFSQLEMNKVAVSIPDCPAISDLPARDRFLVINLRFVFTRP